MVGRVEGGNPLGVEAAKKEKPAIPISQLITILSELRKHIKVSGRDRCRGVCELAR